MKQEYHSNANTNIHLRLELSKSNLSTDDFNVIDVFGKNQLTFRGWPLYYFGKDESPGDNKGVSVPRPGVWPGVNANTPDAPVQ